MMSPCSAPAVSAAKEKKTRGNYQLPGFVDMGTSLLLSVFLILMLVVFSLLTLSSARNNQDFAQTLAQEKKAYFSACNQAERGLAEMENGECNWELTISDSLVLWVEATREGDSVTVHRWQVKNAQPWRNEDTLTVLNP